MKTHQTTPNPEMQEPQTQQRDLSQSLQDYNDIDDLDDTFDQDEEVIDDNLNHGMKINNNGEPIDTPPHRQ